jgi:hypothetical protein
MKYGDEFLSTYLKNYLSDKKNINYEREYVKKIPNKFYRFRACTQNDFNAILEDYIWLSHASEFNDIKDSTIKYNFRTQKTEIFEVFLDCYPFILETELKKKFPKKDFSRIDVNRNLLDEYRNNTLNKNGSYNKSKFQRYMKSIGMNNNEFEIVNNYLENLLSQENVEKISIQLLNDFKQKMKALKDYYYVTCFTETFDNDNLWETYAKRYTGYCIEYDLSSIDEEIKHHILVDFAPIIYGDKKPVDFIDIFKIAKKQYCNEYFDIHILKNYEIQFNLQYRTKSRTYDHEKEWRFYQKKEKAISRKYYFPFISKIYIGKDMNSRNKSRILNIAKTKNIEVFQQGYNLFTSSFSYRKI